MTIKKHIPNSLTLLNLFCGCIALVYLSILNYEVAFFFVCLGIFFDFFDGFFARKFNVSGPLGVQLDSLADMVTSGLVPGFAMYSLLLTFQNEDSFKYLPFLGFIITLGSCYRLANFNIDTRQTNSFIGLPTPANTLFIMSLPLIIATNEKSFFYEMLTNQVFLLVLVILSACMMNAEIPLFSLKLKNFNFKENAIQIIFLAFSVFLLIAFQFLGIALVIITYVLMSVAYNKFSKKEVH